MPLFKYKAITPGGSVQSGIIIGQDLPEVREILKCRGLSVVRVYMPLKTPFFTSSLRIHEEVVKFFEYLRVLLEQKISLTEALGIIECVVNYQSIKKALLQISYDIRQGVGFSEALKQHKHLFSDFIVQCCDNAEKTGTLCGACCNICPFLNMRVAMLKTSKKTLFYPFCVLGALVLLIFAVLQYVIPMTKMFIAETGHISASQKILFFLSDLFVGHTFLFALIFASLIILAFFLYKRWLRTSLLYEKQNWIFWLHMFSSLLLSGVAIKEALHVSNSHMPALKRHLQKIEESIINGVSFYDTLAIVSAVVSQGCGLPRCLPSVLSFAKIGETNGQLGKMLFQCARLEQEHLNYRTEALLARLSPAMLAFAGLVIVWIISSAFVPLYDSIPGY
jgi:type II secretory pathway component PulF